MFITSIYYGQHSGWPFIEFTYMNYRVIKETSVSIDFSRICPQLARVGKIYKNIPYYLPRCRERMLLFAHGQYQRSVQWPKELLRNAFDVHKWTSEKLDLSKEMIWIIWFQWSGFLWPLIFWHTAYTSGHIQVLILSENHPSLEHPQWWHNHNYQPKRTTMPRPI